jgi:hypothetical protein
MAETKLDRVSPAAEAGREGALVIMLLIATTLMARLVLKCLGMNKAAENFSDAAIKAYTTFAPPLSFALFVLAELIFVYGLFRTFAN